MTDRYLDALLASGDALLASGEEFKLRTDSRTPGSPRRPWFLAGVQRDRNSARLDWGVRLASERLTRDLPRFHPSFRFEERLAVRLAEAAVSMRLPLAAGGEDVSRSIPFPLPDAGLDGDPLHRPGDNEPSGAKARPLLVGGALAASALSLAGAAWVAWRRSRPSGSPMARAARAAHAMGGRRTSAIRGRPA